MRIGRLLLTALVFGVLIFFGIGLLVGLDRIGVIFGSADYGLFAAACLCQALSLVTLFLRWNCIVRFKRIAVSNSSLLLATLAGAAFTNLTPSARYGGEPVRVFFLRRHSDAHTAESLATVIAERVFDAVAFLLVSAAVLVLAVYRWQLPSWVTALLVCSFLICAVVVALVVYVSLRKRAGMALALWIIRRFRFLRRVAVLEKRRTKLIRDIETYSDSVRAILARPRLWLLGFGYSLLIWTFDILRLYFVFAALGWPISLPLLGAVLIISALAGIIPLLPGGLGTTEAAMMLVFAAAGVGAAAAGAVTLLDRLLSYWAVTFAGIGAAYYLGLQKYEAKGSYLKAR